MATDKNIEQPLKELHELKAALDEHAIVAITDPQGKIIYANDKFCSISRYSRSELLGQDHRLINSGYHSKEFMRDLWHTIGQGKVWHGEIKNRAKDGTDYWVETTIMPFLNDAGKPRQYVAIRTDITESKRAQEAQERLADIVNSSDDAIIGKTLTGIITDWNPGAEALLGYTAAEMIGRPMTIIYPPERVQEEAEILARIAQGENVRHYETVRMRKDGRPLNVSVTVSPIRDQTGAIIGASKVMRDITDRKRADAEIRKLNAELEMRVARRTAELEAANKELEAFSYSVSHDLRAPLRHVLGFMELLQKEAGPSLSQKSIGHMAMISQATKRMGSLIDDLLAFSRVGRSDMKKSEVNLDQLVKETLEDFQVDTKDRNIVWKIHQLPAVQADRALLRQALVNLVSNAVKFTGTRAEAKIEIGCAPGRDSEIVVFIRDNGAGFDPRYAGKLFGVFQRLHTQEQFEGTGIGLANVQRIIHRHGGRTWAEGVVDSGATFYFSIPKNPTGSE